MSLPPFTRIALSGLLFLWCCGASAQIAPPKRGQKPEPLNRAAAGLLEQMCEAYARLPALNQRSEYSSKAIKLEAPGKTAEGDASVHTAAQKAPDASATGSDSADPNDDDPKRRIDRTVQLLFARPNLLRITDAMANSSGPLETSTWDSDGKSFYAFEPHSHNAVQPLYTQEKAPRSIRDFNKLRNLDAGNLELVMLMGINPFQNLTADTASAEVIDPAIVRGEQTDVVQLSATTPTERDVLRLYIGREDHLLHRFVANVTPVDSSGAPRIGDALDQMEDDAQASIKVGDPDHPGGAGSSAPDDRQTPVRYHSVYDNIITPVSSVEPEWFAFSPPKEASLFMPAGSRMPIDPKSRSLAELIRRSRNAHGKPVKNTTPVREIEQ